MIDHDDWLWLLGIFILEDLFVSVSDNDVFQLVVLY